MPSRVETTTSSSSSSTSPSQLLCHKTSGSSTTTTSMSCGSNNQQSTSVPIQTEKPLHYTYLKEFRVEQCPSFLQHKCTQHKPFTCFNWHFMNQRRRRPVRKRDGTFNYSPDVYCTKYDEATGICTDGDDCPYLHRTAGDTERRYHLRYYKTGICVYDTDSRGYCVKNGAHCAFAHGIHDLRNPVYDLRELQAMEGGNGGPNGPNHDISGSGMMIPGHNHLSHHGSSTSGGEGLNGPNSLDKERNALNEDPRWQETAYVLSNYKTELCKRPPRLCRQGYACPQFHNSKDKRRSLKKYKYRSTPCPNVKQGDEWGDPANCESGDACPYCHTRTEQQFHPEIYKSTKCHDVQLTSYCPRGPFCAFAHNEKEMTIRHEMPDGDLDSFMVMSPVLNGVGSDGDITKSGGGSDPKLHQSVSMLSTSPQNSKGTQTIASSLPDHYLCYGSSLGNPNPPQQHPFPLDIMRGQHQDQQTSTASSLPRDYDFFERQYNQSLGGINIPNAHSSQHHSFSQHPMNKSSVDQQQSGYHHAPPGLRMPTTQSKAGPVIASSLPPDYSYFGSGNHSMFNCLKTDHQLGSGPSVPGSDCLNNPRGASTSSGAAGNPSGTLGPIGTRPRSYSMSTSGSHVGSSLFGAGDMMFKIFDNETLTSPPSGPHPHRDRSGSSGIFGSSDSPIFRNHYPLTENYREENPVETVRSMVGSVLEDSMVDQIDHLLLDSYESTDPYLNTQHHVNRNILNSGNNDSNNSSKNKQTKDASGNNGS